MKAGIITDAGNENWMDGLFKRLKAYLEALVEYMTGKVQELNRDNFAVRQHL